MEIIREYGQIYELQDGNPSLGNELCRRFRDEKLREAMAANTEEMQQHDLDRQGFFLDEKFNFLGWIKIVAGEEEILCYPHLHSEAGGHISKKILFKNYCNVKPHSFEIFSDQYAFLDFLAILFYFKILTSCEDLEGAREMWDLPYKHGWCEVGDWLMIDQ